MMPFFGILPKLYICAPKIIQTLRFSRLSQKKKIRSFQKSVDLAKRVCVFSLNLYILFGFLFSTFKAFFSIVFWPVKTYVCANKRKTVHN